VKVGNCGRKIVTHHVKSAGHSEEPPSGGGDEFILNKTKSYLQKDLWLFQLHW